MCDLPYGRDVWEAVARVPALLTFASGIGVFLGPEAFPGGSASFFVGLVAMAVVARILKLAFGAMTGDAEWTLRPCIGSPRARGFPSSHAMVMGFAAAALGWDAALRYDRAGPGGRGGGSGARDRLRGRRVVFAVLVGVLTLVVAIGRCVQKCHSALQVIVGTLLGLGLGAAYGATVVRRAVNS